MQSFKSVEVRFDFTSRKGLDTNPQPEELMAGYRASSAQVLVSDLMGAPWSFWFLTRGDVNVMARGRPARVRDLTVAMGVACYHPLIMGAVDLHLVLNRDAHIPTFSRATATAAWVRRQLVRVCRQRSAAQPARVGSGYLIEYSLSIDTCSCGHVLSYFRIPPDSAACFGACRARWFFAPLIFA